MQGAWSLDAGAVIYLRCETHLTSPILRLRDIIAIRRRLDTRRHWQLCADKGGGRFLRKKQLRDDVCHGNQAKLGLIKAEAVKSSPLSLSISPTLRRVHSTTRTREQSALVSASILSPAGGDY